MCPINQDARRLNKAQSGYSEIQFYRYSKATAKGNEEGHNAENIGFSQS